MQRWVRARNTGLTILIWVGVVYVIGWVLGHVVTAIILGAMAALLAFAISPGVALLRRWRVPRPLAIILVYLVTLGILFGLLFLIFSTAITQLVAFAKELPQLVKPSTPGHPSPLLRLLQPLGISEDQINTARNAILSRIESSAGTIANSALPVITGIATAIVDAILVFILSIYLVIDGPKVVAWLRVALPVRQRPRVLFFLDVLNTKVGGYIRGQLIMSTLIGVLVGGGMAVFQVPYALLLGVLAFLMEFVPILGTIISGVACVLVALVTRGIFIGLGVAGYFVLVHILEGDIIGPRVMGRAVGLHPAVAILALIAGTELFGLWGAIFSAPIAGIIQAILIALWSEWREAHPEQFPSRRPPTKRPPSANQNDQPAPPPIPRFPATT